MADIAIIGLGHTAIELGRSIKATLPAVEIAGYDPDVKAAKQAHESGAVNTLGRSIPEAIAGASMAVLATPMEAAEGVLKVLGQCAPGGCVVTDTCTLKAPVLRWAATYLPPGIDFVGGHPIMPRAEAEQATPLAGATYCIVPSPGASSQAVAAVVALAQSAKAQPLFIDAGEHDSFVVATEYLPKLAAAAVVDAATQSPAWADVQRFWGVDLERAVAAAEVAPFEFALLWEMEPATLITWLDRVSDLLKRLRGEIEGGLEGSSAAERITRISAERKARLQAGAAAAAPTLERPRAAGLLLGEWLAGRTRR